MAKGGFSETRLARLHAALAAHVAAGDMDELRAEGVHQPLGGEARKDPLLKVGHRDLQGAPDGWPGPRHEAASAWMICRAPLP